MVFKLFPIYLFTYTHANEVYSQSTSITELLKERMLGNPARGCPKSFELDNEQKKTRIFFLYFSRSFPTARLLAALPTASNIAREHQNRVFSPQTDFVAAHYLY